MSSRLPGHVWQDTAVVSALADWDFGTALRRIRQIASLRQEDMSAITGLSQSFLSTLESGARRLVNIEKIISVLGQLDVPADVSPLPLPHHTSRGGPVSGRHPAADPPPEWESPLDIAKRLNTATSTNTDPVTLDLLENEVEGLVNRYETEGPYRLAPQAVDLRRFVQGLLEGRQPPRQREALFRLAARTSGLLAYMAVNAGREAVADAYCTEAVELAREINAHELVMWTFGTRSLNAYYAGHFDQAVQWADSGLEIAPEHPQAIRLLANGRARALGKLGHRAEAEHAVASAEDLSVRHDVEPDLTPCISFAPYGVARTLANAATAYVALGEAQRVLAYADQIDELVERSDSAWSRALVRLDVATALLAGPRPDVEHAMVLGRQVLEADGGVPIRSVVQRAGELHARAGSWQELAAVREYEEALRAWQATPRTRDLVEPATMARASATTRGAAGAAHGRSGRVSSGTTTQHR
ncbi:helix-turn-helix domain-containing protein [Streptomyces sp. URMC 125]|uniref:helix-turn-helix domain-containing protein n=1 Tax=Streptomyces sp. URMC 125 TaxID=3423419 RepID=UPI003F1B4EE5